MLVFAYLCVLVCVRLCVSACLRVLSVSVFWCLCALCLCVFVVCVRA